MQGSVSLVTASFETFSLAASPKPPDWFANQCTSPKSKVYVCFSGTFCFKDQPTCAVYWCLKKPKNGTMNCGDCIKKAVHVPPAVHKGQEPWSPLMCQSDGCTIQNIWKTIHVWNFLSRTSTGMQNRGLYAKSNFTIRVLWSMFS